MKRLAVFAAALAVLAGCATFREGNVPAAQLDGKLLRHVVLFKFKADATAEQIAAVEKAFCALPGKIKEIRTFEWGRDINEPNRAEGITHCFVMTFDSVAAKEAYRAHPAHQEFVAFARPSLEKISVVDYWAK